MLGKIVSIDNDLVLIKLDINIYEVGNLLNKHVVFESDNSIIGEIIKIEDNQLNVALIGEIINNVFNYGTNSKPPFSSPCRLIKKEELDIIFSYSKNNNLIRLGNSYVYKNYSISLNIDTFFANHFAVLGNTGSGKSYAVAKIIQGIFYDAKRLPFKTNIFLFDAYGEYENAFNKIGLDNENINYKTYTSDLKSKNYNIINLPFWLLGVDDIALFLDADNPRQLNIIETALKLVTYFAKEESIVIKQKNSIIASCLLDIIFCGENPSFIRNKLLSVLTRFNTSSLNLDIVLSEPGWNRTLKQCLYLEKDGKLANIELIIKYLESLINVNVELSLADGSFAYTINDFYVALEFALLSEGIFNSDNVYDYANILKIRLNSLINSDYVNYFSYREYITKYDYVKSLLTTDNGKKAQIVNFNINYIDDRFAKVIVKIYSKLLFDFVTKLPKRASFPIHIVLEEAHRYIQNDKDVSLIGYNIFDRITKEGRKYGILLGIVSQRPSEISETAISQVTNFLVFKMFYPKDLLFIESVVPNSSLNELSKIKSLTPGSCIAFGNSFKFPILIKMDKPNPEPLSNNCNIDSTWYV